MIENFTEILIENFVWTLGVFVVATVVATIVGGIMASMAFIAFRPLRGPASVSGGLFQAKPLMNRPEAKLYRMIEHRMPDGYRLLAQVAYAEMVTSKDLQRHFQINARRADMVMVDKGFNVVAVIEYHGAGHWGQNARSAAVARRADRIKRQALEEAGLPLLTIAQNFTAGNIDSKLDQVFGDAPRTELNCWPRSASNWPRPKQNPRPRRRG
ncbi:MAG: DUF2726 domain-containing protein [Aestuariivita sp.]|nr:DUF2726 domain-containing protein [Aestuariivita sp.]MCY4345393.1 DUF2726 domain-containing protein [Aestuariivita sp.]